MKWAFADVSSIVRARQKDAFYIAQFEGKLRGLVGSALGVGLVHRHQSEISAMTHVLYYLLTTGILGSQTLGEEYCSIAPVDVMERDWPSRGKRLLLALAQWARPERASSDLASGLLPLAITLHMALFYWNGRYAEWTRRLLGLRYIYYPRRVPRPVVDRLYKILALTTLVTVLPRLWALIKRYILRGAGRGRANEGGQPELLPNGREDIPPTARCRLCLGIRKDTTVTACGHLFCWSCIYTWIVRAGKDRCPLCRTICDRASLYCVPNDPWLSESRAWTGNP